MKKISLILLSLVIPISLSGQDGSGTSGDPFYGSITTEVTWDAIDFTNGEVYIGKSGSPDTTYHDLTVRAGGHLIINEGVTVIFLLTTSDLIITSSGEITATGSSADPVVFTKADLTANWGHISFEKRGSSSAISGTGSFDHCIVEYGRAATSGTNPNNAGGGIQVNANGVTITNCYFENNYSNFGGAVTVYVGRNTIIRNCRFNDNTANSAGGALLLYTNSTALVENCLFEYNTCNGVGSSGYSGGAIWQYTNASKILNCTFVENTSANAGDAIYSRSSNNGRVINSILWGSNDQFAGITPAVIVTCAFESAKPASATNSIIISDIASDHFIDAGSGDWTLKFISPCRDAGVNSYTGVTIPANDYIGNPRVYTKDIGTYEVQYSRWTGTTSTTWSTATNWFASVDPSTGTGDVVIPTGLTNYPTGSTTQDFTIGSGKQMIIEQGARVSLDDFTNNGIIKLNHNSSGFASFILNSYTRGAGATEVIQLYLTGGGNEDDNNFKWHYISTPVTSLPVSTFAPGTTLDVAQFIESRPSLSLMQGWVAYDGYVYSTGLTNGPTFSNLTPGKGYNYWDNADNTFTFGGLFNTSNAGMSLAYSGTPSLHGFNLLGNPFSSGLNWNDISNSVYFTYPANTSKAVNFTRDNLQCTYNNGVGIPGDVTGIIPPMQGFFVKTSSTGNSVTIPAAARTHSGIHSRYKGDPVIPLVRLSVYEDTVLNDETVVRFDELAKSDLDNDFDAVKMFLSSSKTSIHTVLAGTDYAINGLPFPETGTIIEIPVVVNVTTTGTHKISSIQLQGLDSYDVTLTDNVTEYTANLKTTPDLIFMAPSGLLADRFILKIGNIVTGIEKPETATGLFSIYQGYGFLNIVPLSDEWNGKTGSVRILDLTGKTVLSLQNAEFSRNSVIQLPVSDAAGLYIVQIRSGVNSYVGKVVVR